MLEQGSPIFRVAREDDHPAILAINQLSSPGVAALDRLEISRLLNSGATVTVAEIGNEVAGYLIAFGREDRYNGQEFLWFRKAISDFFVYIDQVAVDPRFRRHGIASLLYEAVFAKSASEHRVILCCEVNVVPANPASMAFHARLGFRQMQQIQVADGRTVALLLRKD